MSRPWQKSGRIHRLDRQFNFNYTCKTMSNRNITLDQEEDTLCYYDEGWNARCRGQIFRRDARRDWQDGWRDCDEADPEDRQEI